ncbi:hypothetical protein BZG76_06020 [Salinivibrio sp. AR647]|uniref:hypothetical protein n=1 Tax=Salinivibrio sp. AR647 TaxID=1909438 RepID=UPI000987BBBA|nr:hypothetical protein [Salinivibrio sp. AR647]OOE92837.1 hypothetical protein BZG76_06020 [Salinivibrio sp. AR647]
MNKKSLPEGMPEGSNRNKIEWIARNLTPPRFKQLYPVTNPKTNAFSIVDAMGAKYEQLIRKDNFYPANKFLGFGDWSAKDVEDYVKSVKNPMEEAIDNISTKYRLLMNYDFSFGFEFHKDDDIGAMKKELESLYVILRLKGKDESSTEILSVLPCKGFLNQSSSYSDYLRLSGAGSALINFDLENVIELPSGQESEPIWKPLEMLITPVAELSDEQAEKFEGKYIISGLNIKYPRRHFDVVLSGPEQNLELPTYALPS